MGQTKPPDAEDARLAEIRLLDLGALRPKIERITRLARTIAEAPIAYVTLAEAQHVWQSGFEDMPENIAPRGIATTIRIVEEGQTIWVDDARAVQPDHVWVAGPPYVRFYCGTPIRLASDICIGALCVAGPEPRERDEALIGRLEDLAALIADDVERLRAERQLAASEAEAQAANRLLASFVELAPVALAMTDKDLRFVQVSPRWREENTLGEPEIAGHGLEDVFPEAFALWESFCRKALAGKTIRADRLRVPLPGGEHRWLRLEMSPWRNSVGEVGGLLIMTGDITDMVHSLEEAERSQQRLRLAIEIADLLVYEIDYREKTLRTEGAEDTFFSGHLTFEDIQTNIWESVHPDDLHATRTLWRRHITEGVPFRTEHRMRRKDGVEVWAFAAAETIMGADGRVERIVGVLKNITDRRRSETAMLAARDAAQAANVAKSEFLANMSHEIRTPLNGVIGVASALARTPLSPVQSEMVGLIETSGQTLEAILADVLDLARIESGRLELKRETFDLAECLRSAAALFEPAALAKGLDFDLDIAPEAKGLFEGDPVRIRQILCNLLSNAVKFTAAGQIALIARAEPAGDSARLSLSVSDSGIGFAPEFKARLFERFEQADGSITRRFGGSGLGLSISRSLANAMDGELDAVSRPGRGATFTLTLELPRAGEAQAPVAALPPVTASGGTARVLLAEDHAVNRRVVELILGAAGVDLTCVENGQLAVEEAARGGFDLILMDMQMPVMDGLTAIGAIRRDELARNLPHTPIWALSANALPEHLDASLKAGADGHLTKPISAQALLGVVFRPVAPRQTPRARRA